MADDEPGRSSHIPEGLEATPGILALYEKYGARYPWWVILVSMTGAFATLLTGTIVNVAIPDIMGALGITIDQAQNIVTIFLAAGTVTMLMSPWCMRAFGIARTYVAALSVFAVSSALGGFATTGEAMVLARLVQGAAAGLVMPISMVLVAQVFPVHRRGMAMGVMSVGTVLAPALGPTIGGYLVDDLSWRWVFFIAIPFVAVSAPCATFLFPSREETGPKPSFDWTGAVLCSIFLVGLLTGLTEAQSEGWYDDRTLIPLAIGVVACALWILWETHAPEPMLDLRLLRHFGFVGAAIVTLTVGVGLYGSTYLFPLFLQQISMLVPTDSGLIMAPAGLAMAALFPLSGYLADRYSKRGIIAIGLVLVAWSSYLMKDADAFTPVATMVGWYVIGRVGLALIFPALNAGDQRVAAGTHPEWIGNDQLPAPTGRRLRGKPDLVRAPRPHDGAPGRVPRDPDLGQQRHDGDDAPRPGAVRVSGPRRLSELRDEFQLRPRRRLEPRGHARLSRQFRAGRGHSPRLGATRLDAPARAERSVGDWWKAPTVTHRRKAGQQPAPSILSPFSEERRCTTHPRSARART